MSARIMLFILPLLAIACAAEDAQNAQSPSTEASAPASGSSVAAAESDASDSMSSAAAEYSVECGQVDEDGQPFCYVDRDTYVGWRTYHGFCHVCHAQDAVGSTFAPSLVSRMRESDMNWELYLDRMDNGYTGQIGVMPPWKDNPNVSTRYKELYNYLMARADGALPPGRPKRFPVSR